MDLLELQRVDSTMDRLETRRRHLPEQAEVDALEERLSTLEQTIVEAKAVVGEIAGRQRRLENNIEMIYAKIRSEEERLYSGRVANPRELADLQREIESLKRRVSGLEDSDLEVMEELDVAERRLRDLQAEVEGARSTLGEARQRCARAAAEIEAALEASRAEREAWRPKLDSSLLSLYDELRASKGGVGVAAMMDGVCQGCHMRLPAQEYERARTAQGVVRCDDCRRILVVL
ncbi:MAG: zinc ribbon domain-containing protein [Actinomycetota bacterium]